MRTPPAHIVEALQRYDRLLNVQWVERDPEDGSLIQRWRIVRVSPRTGEYVHIMFWQNMAMDSRGVRYSAYRELEEGPLMEELMKRDRQRYATIEDYMHALGMKASDTDPFKEVKELEEERRYTERTKLFVERMEALKKEHPEWFDFGSMDKEEEMALEEKMEHASAVNEAIRTRTGKIQLSKRGVPIRVE